MSSRKGRWGRRRGPGAGGGRQSRAALPSCLRSSDGAGKRTLCELTVESVGVVNRLISGVLMKRC